MKFDDLKYLNEKFKNSPVEDIIDFIYKEFANERIILASSMSIEDQVLSKILIDKIKNPRIFFIDTGRHFQETYDLINQMIQKYKIKYEIYAPDGEKLKEVISNYGPNLFYYSIELRKLCCEIRKVEPLKKVLSTVDVWICGLRKEQSVTRSNLSIFEWDEVHKIFKINPLVNWNEEEILNYINKSNIPYNVLYNKGFKSIGCMPCTRAVKHGDNIRSGRWWWEDPETKECGLHLK